MTSAKRVKHGQPKTTGQRSKERKRLFRGRNKDFAEKVCAVFVLCIMIQNIRGHFHEKRKSKFICFALWIEQYY